MDLKTHNNTKKEGGVKHSFQAFDLKPGRILQLNKMNAFSSGMTCSFIQKEQNCESGDHQSCQVEIQEKKSKEKNVKK